MMLNEKSDNIRIDGYRGSWYVIDRTIKLSREYFLLESEVWGDEAPCLIVDAFGRLIKEDVWNGFLEF